MAEREDVELDREIVQSLTPARAFTNGDSTYTSLNFFRDGESLVVSDDEGRVDFIDVVDGIVHKTIYMKENGCAMAKFTHHRNNIIAAATNEPMLMYYSFHDNKYLRTFHGHLEKITSLAMSPVDDTFMSAASDGDIRLWDLRTHICRAVIKGRGSPAVSFDPQGLIFAVASEPNIIALYDARSIENGAFATFSTRQAGFNGHISFSPSGEQILVGSSPETFEIIDAFEGESICELRGFANSKRARFQPSYSPDGNFVASGADSGLVHIWDASSGNQVTMLKAGHPAPTEIVQFNPCRVMLASACHEVALWLPS